MHSDTNSLIADLVDDLRPVRPLKLSRGLTIAAAGAGVTLGVVALLFGIRPDVVSGRFDPVFLLSAGLFLMLGVAASVTVIVMSRPQVGTDHGGWLWAAAMAALLPLTALVMGLADGPRALAQSSPDQGMGCLMVGSALALITGAALTWWLRRGAPTSPERAGLLTGIAAGSFGIFAFSFHCPYSDIYHIGLWHSLVVVAGAVVGRLVVPRLVRW
jgi:hypothetical protein